MAPTFSLNIAEITDRMTQPLLVFESQDSFDFLVRQESRKPGFIVQEKGCLNSTPPLSGTTWSSEHRFYFNPEALRYDMGGFSLQRKGKY